MNMKLWGVDVSRHEPIITADVFKNLWIMDGTNNNNNEKKKWEKGKVSIKRGKFPVTCYKFN